MPDIRPVQQQCNFQHYYSTWSSSCGTAQTLTCIPILLRAAPSSALTHKCHPGHHPLSSYTFFPALLIPRPPSSQSPGRVLLLLSSLYTPAPLHRFLVKRRQRKTIPLSHTYINMIKTFKLYAFVCLSGNTHTNRSDLRQRPSGSLRWRSLLHFGVRDMRRCRLHRQGLGADI